MPRHLHPMLVHFPIALFITAFVLEFFVCFFKKDFFRKPAAVNFILATLMTIPAVLAGLEDAEELNLHHPILNIHKNFALATLSLAIVGLLVLWRLKQKDTPQNRLLWRFCLLALVVTVTVTAYNGGRMVYEYGIGVAP